MAYLLNWLSKNAEKSNRLMGNKMDVSSIPEAKKGMINPKVFLIGLPLFILQLVVVYFVTANILLSKMQATGVNPAGVVADSLKGKASSAEKDATEVGVNVLNLDDIIVNPTGTNGQRLLLASVGVDLPNKEELDGLQKKKEILTDIVISALSSKSINQLNSIAYRDTIKAEITNSISKKIPKTKINSIYFSKFIIQ